MRIKTSVQLLHISEPGLPGRSQFTSSLYLPTCFSSLSKAKSQHNHPPTIPYRPRHVRRLATLSENTSTRPPPGPDLPPNSSSPKKQPQDERRMKLGRSKPGPHSAISKRRLPKLTTLRSHPLSTITPSHPPRFASSPRNPLSTHLSVSLPVNASTSADCLRSGSLSRSIMVCSRGMGPIPHHWQRQARDPRFKDGG